MNTVNDELLGRFERLEISASDFRHHDHVHVAFEMLERYQFIEACSRYSATIRSMAESVGAAEKFNVTITLAFMSLIAERKGRCASRDPDAFLESNADLLDSRVLQRWYSKERLTSSTARLQLLLPDRIPIRRRPQA